MTVVNGVIVDAIGYHLLVEASAGCRGWKIKFCRQGGSFLSGEVHDTEKEKGDSATAEESTATYGVSTAEEAKTFYGFPR